MNGFQGETQFRQSRRGKLGEAGRRSWERPPAQSSMWVAKSLDISLETEVHPLSAGCVQASGVLSSQGPSQWGAGVFPLSKRDP